MGLLRSPDDVTKYGRLERHKTHTHKLKKQQALKTTALYMTSEVEIHSCGIHYKLFL